MLNDFVTSCIRSELPFTPNDEQAELLQLLGAFLVSTDDRRLFLLKGYAGTGKTSIVSGMVRAMSRLGQKTLLLAPTGRAAKVLTSYAHRPAYTIHKKLYRQRTVLSPDFSIAPNLLKDTLFIVDEASMISNQPYDNAAFGTGLLLDDLIMHVYSSPGCALLLLGDTAQLPPVGQTLSPALDVHHLEGYGLNVSQYTLTQVARQALESGILLNATWLRQQIVEHATHKAPRLQLTHQADIQAVQGVDVQELIQDSYDSVGMEQTMIVTRTNRRASMYNRGIRARILWRDDEISTGDRIMITRNNYYWTREYDGIEFLANGDIFEITRLRNERELYGFRFVDASLLSLDYEWEIDVTLLLDSLMADTAEQVREQQQRLAAAVAEDYPEIRNRRDLMKAVMDNPYYNALQFKFAYAATCHKSQGGQWKHVYVDPGLLQPEQIDMDYYRWLYTALTRATERVFLLNMPSDV